MLMLYRASKHYALNCSVALAAAWGLCACGPLLTSSTVITERSYEEASERPDDLATDSFNDEATEKPSNSKLKLHGNTREPILAQRDDEAWSRRVAESARWHLRNRPRKRIRDCSSLVESILRRAGVDLRGNAHTLWEDARRDGRVLDASAKAQPGYLAFFDRTYDANRNGRIDDTLTHIAVVISVDAQGTVLMVHRGSGRIKELWMNRRAPATHRASGRVINDYLRKPGYGHPNGPRLSAQLLRGFARPPSRFRPLKYKSMK